MRVSELKDLEGFCGNECSQIPCHMFINPITHRNRLRAAILAKDASLPRVPIFVEGTVVTSNI